MTETLDMEVGVHVPVPVPVLMQLTALTHLIFAFNALIDPNPDGVFSAHHYARNISLDFAAPCKHN
jgi:hypothetical protein